uniref:Aminotransferase-like plant mobile domain-containing protein n=1 Tax=Oryza glumipatula TaxID=40148 RepID=A0A0E0BS84_9ORYZ
MANRSHAIKNTVGHHDREHAEIQPSTGTLVCSPHAMSEVILHLSPPQKKAIEVSGFGNLLNINKIHIYRDLCNEIARSYDKEKKAFNINGQTTITLEALREAIINSSIYDDHFIQRFILFSIGSFICPTTQRYVRSEFLNLVDEVDKMRELNWSSLTLNQLLKGILKFREKETNIEGNVCLLQIWYWEKVQIDKLDATIYHSGRQRPLIQYWDKIKDKKRLSYLFGKGKVVDDIRGTIHCKEIPNEKAHDNDSETCTDEDFVCTSEEDVEQEQIDPREHVSNHNEESYINQNENMTCETKDNSNQINQSRKRLTGPIDRTYKPTNRIDFIYETRGKKKDIIRTQAQTKKTIVYIEKEDLTQQIIDKGPPKNALRGQKKTKTNGQTPLKNSEGA